MLCLVSYLEYLKCLQKSLKYRITDCTIEPQHITAKSNCCTAVSRMQFQTTLGKQNAFEQKGFCC